MHLKQRLSASVDPALIAAAEDAVAKGRFVSVSAWVNEALRLKVAHDRRLDALAVFVAEFEREHGAISSDEMDAAARRARGRAIPVRATRRAMRNPRPAAHGRRKAG
jgi:Arc/MetJ-type ribon-helix-helix transcriptional regulator